MVDYEKPTTRVSFRSYHFLSIAWNRSILWFWPREVLCG